MKKKRGGRISKTVRELVATFEKESDRAVLVVAVSKIEDLLAQILEKRLLIAPKERSINIEMMPFGNKAELCVRLGLISELMQSVLLRLAALRNKLSHTYYPFTFEDKEWPHRDLVERILGKGPLIKGRKETDMMDAFFIAWDALPSDIQALKERYTESIQRGASGQNLRDFAELLLLSHIAVLEGILKDTRRIKPQWGYRGGRRRRAE